MVRPCFRSLKIENISAAADFLHSKLILKMKFVIHFDPFQLYVGIRFPVYYTDLGRLRRSLLIFLFPFEIFFASENEEKQCAFKWKLSRRT